MIRRLKSFLSHFINNTLYGRRQLFTAFLIEKHSSALFPLLLLKVQQP